MNKAVYNNDSDSILITLNETQDLLHIGKASCVKLCEDAGAIVKIGRRKLVNKTILVNHIDSISGKE